MTVHLHYFALLQDQRGLAQETLNISQGQGRGRWALLVSLMGLNQIQQWLNLFLG